MRYQLSPDVFFGCCKQYVSRYVIILGLMMDSQDWKPRNNNIAYLWSKIPKSRYILGRGEGRTLTESSKQAGGFAVNEQTITNKREQREKKLLKQETLQSLPDSWVLRINAGHYSVVLFTKLNKLDLLAWQDLCA
jgi:hypothetical protein